MSETSLQTSVTGSPNAASKPWTSGNTGSTSENASSTSAATDDTSPNDKGPAPPTGGEQTLAIQNQTEIDMESDPSRHGEEHHTAADDPHSDAAEDA